MAEPMIKGGALREFVQWYGINHGKERLREVAQNLPEEMRSYIDPDDPIVNLLAASWYPSRFCNVLLDAVSEGLSQPEIERMAHDATRWIVQRGMNSVYRFALRRLVTPEMYAASVPRLWRQLHTTGDREMRVTSPTTAESKVLNWGGHHSVMCTVTIETMCAVFETMRCQHVTWKRVACVSRGASECVTLLEWK
jgi:hypothetical protein